MKKNSIKTRPQYLDHKSRLLAQPLTLEPK